MDKRLSQRAEKYTARQHLKKMITTVSISLSLLVMLSVSLSMVQKADATNIAPSCGYVEHKHTAKCYYRKLVCQSSDPEHIHDETCFDYVLVCGMHGHVHNAQCFESESNGHFVSLIELFSPAAATAPEQVVVETASHAVTDNTEIIPTPAPVVNNPLPDAEVLEEFNRIDHPEEYAQEPQVSENPAANETGKDNNVNTETIRENIPVSEPARNDEENDTPDYIINRPELPVQQETAPVSVTPAAEVVEESVHVDHEEIDLSPVLTEEPQEEITEAVEYYEPVTIEYLNASPAVTEPLHEVIFDYRTNHASSVSYTIILNGEELETGMLDSEEGSIVWTPETAGDFSIRLTAADARGNTAETTTRGTVYQNESKEEWLRKIRDLELTGEWCRDIVTVAQSQKGTPASRFSEVFGTNGLLTERKDDEMFLSVVLNAAGIPESRLSEFTMPNGTAGSGDIICLDYDRDGKADHSAIVTDVQENILNVIEADQNGIISEGWYSADDEAIVSRVDMKAVAYVYEPYALTNEEYGVTVYASHASDLEEDTEVEVFEIQDDGFVMPEEEGKKITEVKSYDLAFFNSLGERVYPNTEVRISVEGREENVTILSETEDAVWKKNSVLEYKTDSSFAFHVIRFENIHVLESAEGEVRATLTYTDKAEIPETAHLEVTRVEDDAEYAQKANEVFENIEEARFYEIGIYDGERRIEPKDTVNISIEGYEQAAAENELHALQFTEDNVTVAEATYEEGTVSFDTPKEESVQPEVTGAVADEEPAEEGSEPAEEVVEEVPEETAEEFSEAAEPEEIIEENKIRTASNRNETLIVNEETGQEAPVTIYGIIETTIEATVITADGETYEITVRYGPDAKIPDGAYLDAHEITAESDGYEGYLASAKEALNNAEISYARFFDIAIMYGEEKVEPSDEVKVAIRYVGHHEYYKESLNVIHFGEEIVALSEDKAEIASDEAGYETVMFETDAFSVYAVCFSVTSEYEIDESGRIILTYEDDEVIGTVKMEPGTVTEDAVFEIREIRPDSPENADSYAETLTLLSEALKQENKSFSAGIVYDLKILNIYGEKIEPDGNVFVTISYKQNRPFGESEDRNIQVAHLKEDAEQEKVEFLDSFVKTSEDGTILDAAFNTDSFSTFVFYKSDSVTASSGYPTAGSVVGSDSIGWIRFADAGEGLSGTVNGALSDHFPLGTEDGYKRAVQIKFYMLNNGAAAKDSNGNIIPENYSEMSIPETYFWTWENSFQIEDYELRDEINGNSRTYYELIGTIFKTAWDEVNNPGNEFVEADSLIGTYAVRGVQSSDQTSYSLNTLDVYLQGKTTQWDPTNDMRYIVEYIHADGSRTGGSVQRLTSGGSASVSAANYVRTGESYAGLTVGAGYEAVESINNTNGTATIRYNRNVPLVKITLYYKKNEQPNATQVNGYDKNNNLYDNSRLGLHTDKRVTGVNEDSREYNLTLESWNIVRNAADVAMVLDASGSMAWAAGNDKTGDLVPVEVPRNIADRYTKYTNPAFNINNQSTWKLGYYYGNQPSYLSESDVNSILYTHYSDNSKLNYGGFSYYVYCAYSDISEYVALGYNSYSGRTDGIGRINNVLGQNYNGAGWYFVDTVGDPKYLASENYSNKDFLGIAADNSSNWRSSFGNTTPVKPRFYIDNNGILHCVFYKNNYNTNGNGATGNNSFFWDSIVYEKKPTSPTKTEVLQDSIGQFTSILKAQMEGSRIAMTRFSHANFAQNGTGYGLDKLVLKKWSSDSSAIISAMNNSERNGTANSNGEYNFTLTGGTVTKNGVGSYIQNLAGTAGNNKYIVIFTDGKDTNGDADSNTGGETGNLVRNNANSLVNQGYTVFTVLMRSKSMVDGSTSLINARNFLRYLATGNRNSATENGVQKYFEADADDPTGLVDAFRKIALSITSLEGYTIQDYVDPRFDVVNSAGDVLSVLDQNGNFTNGKSGADRIDWSITGREFTTQDGKLATLYYDKPKKMFYIQWQNQQIGSNARGETVVHPWNSSIRLRAKEDFIGGNDIVTNGDEAGQNRVFYPGMSSNNAAHEQYPAKDLPRTAVNVPLLELNAVNYEDTVFLGETIIPKDLLSYLEGEVDKNEYIEYLRRVGAKDKNNADFYISQLAQGEQVAVDYRYIGSSDNRIYAGIDQQNDIIGKLIYTWEPVDESGNRRNPDSGNESSGWTGNNGFVADKTQDYRYKLMVRYVAAKQNEEVSIILPDETTSTLKTRISELTKYVPSNNTLFPGVNELTKPPLGETVSEKTVSSLAVIHVVDGRIHLEKKVDKTDLLGYLEGLENNATLQFVFHLKKDQTSDYRKVSLVLSKTGESTDMSGVDSAQSEITISLSQGDINELVPDEDGMIDIFSMWLTSLPTGDYTLSETVSDDGFVLDSMIPISDYYEQNYPTQEDLEKYLAQSAPVAGSNSTESTAITWYIGKTAVNTVQQYPDCVEGNVQFPISKVTDQVKEVDPMLAVNNGKVYLNAQIGEAIIQNRLLSGEFSIDKLDKDNESLALDDVEFTLYHASVQGNVWSKGEQFGEAQTTTKEPGEVHAYAFFNGLKPGYYLLYETRARMGYIMPSDPWKVTVSKNQDNEIEVEITDADGTVIPMNDGVVTLTNSAGYQLPSTGGPGRNICFLTGGLLMGIGILLKKFRH